MIAFHHDKDMDILKLGFTLPSLGYICLHKSSNSKLYVFPEGENDLLDEIREGQWSIYRFHPQSSCS